jgi:hypothetical protein
VWLRRRRHDVPGRRGDRGPGADRGLRRSLLGAHDRGARNHEKCIEHSHDGGEPVLECKPAAGSIAALSNGKVLYFNALEGTENIQNGTAAEFGNVSVNDQTRVLDLAGPTWT